MSLTLPTNGATFTVSWIFPSRLLSFLMLLTYFNNQILVIHILVADFFSVAQHSYSSSSTNLIVHIYVPFNFTRIDPWYHTLHALLRSTLSYSIPCLTSSSTSPSWLINDFYLPTVINIWSGYQICWHYLPSNLILSYLILLSLKSHAIYSVLLLLVLKLLNSTASPLFLVTLTTSFI